MAGIVETPVQIIQEVLPNPIYATLTTENGQSETKSATIQVNRKIDNIILQSSCSVVKKTFDSYGYGEAISTAVINYKNGTTKNISVTNGRVQVSGNGSDNKISIFSEFDDEITSIIFEVAQQRYNESLASFACGTIVII